MFFRVVRVLLVWIMLQPLNHTLQAQVFESGDQLISAGAGWPGTGAYTLAAFSRQPEFKVSGAGPFHLKYDRFFRSTLSAGLVVNAGWYDGSWNDTGYQTSIRGAAWSALLRVNRYLVNKPAYQLYAGLGVGFRGRTVKYSTDPLNTRRDTEVDRLLTPLSFPLGLEMTAGGRFRLSPRLGAYVEVGFSKAIIQAGFYARF